MSKHKRIKSELTSLPFYSPKRLDVVYDTSSNAEKSRKFLKLQNVDKFSPPDFRNFPLTTTNRSSYSKQSTKELLEWDLLRKVTEFTTDRGETTIYTDHNEGPFDLRDSSPIQKKSSKEWRTLEKNVQGNNEDIITKLLGSRTKVEINKIYDTAREFESLKIIADEKQEISKEKLLVDKLRKTAIQFNRLKTDVSHIFDKKPTRLSKPESPKSLTINLPELKQRVKNNLQHSLEGLQSQELNSPKSAKAILNLHGNNLINNSLTTSSFFKTKARSRRTATLGFFPRDSLEQSPIAKDFYFDPSSPSKSERPIPSMYQSQSKFSFHENSILGSLKKEIPNLASGGPVSRHEVLLMGKWLLRTIDSINVDPNIPAKEKFEKADEVYQACLHELVRQVSIDCNERAELLMKVWRAYIDLTNDILEDYKSREFDIEEKANKEYDMMSKNFIEKIKTKNEEIEKLRAKIEAIHNYYKELGEKAELAFKQEERALEENKRLMQGLNKYKKNYVYLVQENKDLEYKLTKLKQRLDFTEDDSLDLKLEAAQSKKDIDSDSSIVETHQKGQGFGTIKQKLILKLDRDTSYQDLTYTPKPPPENREAQTELVLIDERYNRILKDMERVNDIWREEVIKEKLVHEAEFLENLAQNEELTENELKRIQLLLKADQIRRRQQGEDIENSYATNEYDEPLSVQYRLEENKSDGSDNPKRLIQGLLKLRESLSKSVSGMKHSKISGYSNDLPNSSIRQNDDHQSIDFLSQVEVPTTERIQENLPSDRIIENEDIKRDDVTEKNPLDENQIEGDKQHEDLYMEEKILNLGEKAQIGILNSEQRDEEETNEVTGPEILTIPTYSQKVSISKEDPKDPRDEHMNLKKTSSTKGMSMIESKNPIAEVEEEFENHSPIPSRHKLPLKKKGSIIMPAEAESLPGTQRKVSMERSKSIGSSSSRNSSPKSRHHRKKSNQHPEEKFNNSSSSIATTSPQISAKKKFILESNKKSPETSPLQKINNKFMISSPENTTVTSPKQGRGWAKLKSTLLKKAAELGPPDNSSKDHQQKAAVLPKPTESKRDTNSLNDKKALELLEKNEQKIVKFMGMYKIEKKKQEELSGINKELETRIARDAKLINELQQIISDLKENQTTVPAIDKFEKLTKKIEDRTKHIQKLNELRPQLINENLVEDDDEEPVKVVTLKSLDRTTLYEGIVRERRQSGRGMTLGINKKLVAIEKHNFAAQSIIAKLKANFQRKLAKLKGLVPVKAILRQINSFYLDRFHMARENPIIKEQDMATFVYRQFINTFGFQKFAIEKFNKFALSVKKHYQVPRITKFAKMMGLFDEGQNYTLDEIKQYLAGMEFLVTAVSIGINYPNSDYEKKHYVPWVRAAEYVKIFGEKRMRVEELQDFRKECEKVKIRDPSNRNIGGVVDIDEFLEKIVIRYKVMMNRGKETWMTAFKAADLDNDQKVTVPEFAAIFKYMEAEKYDEKKIEEIFTTQYDIVDGDSVALSFERFLSVSFEYNIFSEMRQNQFLGIQSDFEIKEIFQSFKEKWTEEKNRLLALINEKSKYSLIDSVDLWTKAVEVIENNLLAENLYEQKACLIKHKIINLDLLNIN